MWNVVFSRKFVVEMAWPIMAGHSQARKEMGKLCRFLGSLNACDLFARFLSRCDPEDRKKPMDRSQTPTEYPVSSEIETESVASFT